MRARHLLRPVVVRFLIVGASGCVVNTAALSIVYGHGHVTLPLASAVSSEVAIITNYLLNDTWTFPGTSASWMRFARFNVVACAGLGLAALIVWVLVEHVGMDYLLANLVALAVSGTLNLGLSATWVWGQARANHYRLQPGRR